jgi:Xaa-Pro aminopeptidase
MITASEIENRVKRLRSRMEEKGMNALLVTAPKNTTYLTGRDTGRLLLTKFGNFLWTREIYKEIYSDLYCDKKYPLDVMIYEKDAVKSRISELGIKCLHVDNPPVMGFEIMKKDLGIELAATDVIEQQRMVKTALEIELLRKAAGIAVIGMEKAYDVVCAGVKEMEALAEVEYAIRKAGSDAPPFDDGMLLASGANSADIHARAGSGKIKKGSTVVVDLGGRYNGYYSDMTRTIPVGSVDSKTKELLEYVDNLRAEAIGMLKPGVVAGDVHAFIENDMKKKGYKFYHSSGHGVGLNIHENPGISRDSPDVLCEDMVFTIEPGIYIAGKYGIRFEDTILLKKNRAKILTEYKR